MATDIKIKAREEGRSSVDVRATNRWATLHDDGHGNGLLQKPPYSELPIRAQLVNSEGVCWEATYDDRYILKNDAAKFVGRSVAPSP